ncbi:MAG: class I SAM-dependent methyltransferase [Pirellulales bacterium]
MSSAANPYDEVPFPSQPLPHSQPARLGAIAAMFGMQPTPADRCRVLELGCATGGNLIPLADRHAGSTFVGIDYSQVQIDAARRVARALGLANIELECASIADLGDELGTFDYIICHGVYSWVPRDVQNKILWLCRTALNPQGVAYVSYNTYPAWHLRLLVRQALGGCSRQGSSEQRLAQGRALLEWLSSTMASDQTPFGRLLTVELDGILRQPGEYLFHEYFESDNKPLYFHELARRAAEAELQYLGDAVPSRMFAANYGPAVEQRLLRMTDDPIATEQHLDVLCNRGVRRTLLCHREVALSRRPLADRFLELYFCGQITPERAEGPLRSWTPATFAAQDGTKITHSAPLVKALLDYFGSQWPRSLSIDEATRAVAELVAAEGHPPDASARTRQLVIQNVVQFVAGGLVEPTSAPDSFTTSVGLRPRASRLARLQAQSSKGVTNRRHETVHLDDDSRRVLGYLDGQRDREALLAALVQALERGELTMAGGRFGVGALGGSRELAVAIAQWLTQLAAGALLVD